MMNVRILTRKVARMLTEEGVAPLCRRAVAHLRNQQHKDSFDLENGTETSGLEPLWKLNINSPNAQFGERYEATTQQELVSVLQSLDVSPENSTFIDLGCGKGRTLIIASQFGFKQAIGVEFAQELFATAQKNISSKRLTNATVVHADAAEFLFPHGNKVIYLYNPFSEEVLSRVLDNLRRCVEDNFYVVYKSPRCGQLLDSCDFLKRHKKAAGALHIDIWQHYPTDSSRTLEAAQ